MPEIKQKNTIKEMSLLESIKKHHESLFAAQERFFSVQKNKKVLVIDLAFHYPGQLVEQAIEKLNKVGREDISEIYQEHMLKHQGFMSTGKIYQNFLGDRIKIDTYEIGKDLYEIDCSQYSVIMFTGSPSCIGEALRNPHSKVLGKLDVTNLEVVEQSLKIYKQAQKLNLPAIGICYGHQLISYANGAEIGVVNPRQRGLREITKYNDYSDQILREIKNKDYQAGYVPVFHQEQVSKVSNNSIELFGSPGIEVKYGLLHSNHINFTKMLESDTTQIANVFAEKKHIALTFQCHPEYNFIEKLMTYAFDGEFKNGQKFIDPYTTAHFLDLISDFLDRHYN